MTDNRFKKLLEPGYIGKVRTKNRMVKMGAHHGYYPYKDGYVDEKCYGFYEALAHGGVGLITVQHAEIEYRKGLHGPAGTGRQHRLFRADVLTVALHLL